MITAECVTLLPGIMVSLLVIECANGLSAATPGSAGMSGFDILAFVVSISVRV